MRNIAWRRCASACPGRTASTRCRRRHCPRTTSPSGSTCSDRQSAGRPVGAGAWRQQRDRVPPRFQLAHARGATIYATAGTDEKCALCRSLGAAEAINYRQQDFAERIKALTGGRGVDVILDMIGASYFQRNLDSLADDGRLVTIAVLGGDKVDGLKLSQLMRRRLTLTGSTLRPRSAAFKGRGGGRASRAGLAAAFGWRDPAVDPRRAALHWMRPSPYADESGSHSGKIMLTL